MPMSALVRSIALYGVAYVARPIGAFVLGHWGDTHGRKNMLVLCMLLMGASTFVVGLLPTYQAIGIWAPILLLILRLIQGFAVGGELSGASAMIIALARIASTLSCFSASSVPDPPTSVMSRSEFQPSLLARARALKCVTEPTPVKPMRFPFRS